MVGPDSVPAPVPGPEPVLQVPPVPGGEVATTDVTGLPDPEDAKLVVLARSAAVRSGGTGAAVRDGAGRTYLAGPVAVGPLRLGAVEAAVAQAVASGVTSLVAVAVVGDEVPDPELLVAVGSPALVRG